MAKQKPNPSLMTPEFRVSFPAVFAPRAANPGDKLKYGLHMLFPKTADITVLKQAVLAAGVAKWGADRTKWPNPLMLPFRDGAEKDYDGYGKDIIFVNTSSLQKPGLVDQNVQDIIEPSEFYGGCYARATVNAFAWTYMNKNGISFGLRNVQKVRDGDAFSGASKPQNDFDSIPMPGGGLPGATAAAAANDPLGDLGGGQLTDPQPKAAAAAAPAAAAAVDPLAGLGDIGT